MTNILVLGNGFDLAHKLKTSYNDFLKFLIDWKSLIKVNKINSELVEQKLLLKKEHLEKYNFLNDQIENNSWINYYKNCKAEINGWIDFEKEMLPVIRLFSKIVRNSKEGFLVVRTDVCYLSLDILSKSEENYIHLWEKYISSGTYQNKNVLKLHKDYCVYPYGLLADKLLSELMDEWECFVEVFRCYLLYFAVPIFEKNSNIQLQLATEISPDYVITFNYTETEKKYWKNADIYHIHGTLNSEINEDEKLKNNMVMGVNEVDNEDFIMFTKYFQRIQKHSSIAYKQKLKIDKNEKRTIVYGHSLDVTDKDVLCNLFDMSSEILIYYLDQYDYGKKVLNLIKLYGIQTIEEWRESEKLQFKKIQ